VSGVKTDWNLANLPATDDDPFAAVVYSTGLDLDLTAGEDDLVQQYFRLLRIEYRMADAGLSCGLKDGGQGCLDCPSATLERSETRSILCRLGKDEETITRLHEVKEGQRMDPVRELADAAGAAMEIGSLDAALAEWLTAVTA
jgi:hypothetical protein